MLRLFVLLLCFTVATIKCAYDGDDCLYSNDDPDGICTLIFNCPTAVNMVNKSGDHDLKRCGFEGDVEIVCCRRSDKLTITSKHLLPRKIITACQRFSTVPRTAFVSPQILGGKNVSIGEFPHMAAIGYEGVRKDPIEWGCGGALINERYVLTAAHCLAHPTSPAKVVRLGVIDITGRSGNIEPQDFEIEADISHPNYNYSTKINDIALLRLKRKVVFSNYVRPACLHTKQEDPKILTIIGWGNVFSGGPRSEFLLKADVNYVDNNSCKETFQRVGIPRPIFRSQLCARFTGKNITDTCQGDSGGPIQYYDKVEHNMHKIVGVTSFGDGCGGVKPSVYTRIYNYLDWIERTAWAD